MAAKKKLTLAQERNKRVREITKSYKDRGEKPDVAKQIAISTVNKQIKEGKLKAAKITTPGSKKGTGRKRASKK